MIETFEGVAASVHVDPTKWIDPQLRHSGEGYVFDVLPDAIRTVMDKVNKATGHGYAQARLMLHGCGESCLDVEPNCAIVVLCDNYSLFHFPEATRAEDAKGHTDCSLKKAIERMQCQSTNYAYGDAFVTGPRYSRLDTLRTYSRAPQYLLVLSKATKKPVGIAIMLVGSRVYSIESKTM